MLYFVVEDLSYFNSSFKAKLKKEYSIENIFPCLNYNDIKKVLSKMMEEEPLDKDTKLIISSISHREETEAIISFTLPENFDKSLKYFPFEIIKITNEHGILTNFQKNFLDFSEINVLKEKLEIDVHDYRKTLSIENYAKSQVLDEIILEFRIKNEFNLPIKGIFLAGIPGTGKSFLAKCLSGEMNRLLVEMNFSIIMEKPQPLMFLKKVVNQIYNLQGRYIIWVDEIEKMFVNESSQQILGAFLTILNESAGKNSFFICTANDIKKMIDKNPEFFRSGRFDANLFTMPPLVKPDSNLKNLVNILITKNEKNFKNDLLVSVLIKIYLKKYDGLELMYNFSEKSLIFKIQENFLNILDEENRYYRELNKNYRNKNEDNLRKSIKVLLSADENFEKNIFKNITSFRDSFNFDSFIEETMVEYRSCSVRDGMGNQYFPYSQAEIEKIIADLFLDFYIKDVKDEAEKKTFLQDTIKKSRPLGLSGKEAIDLMISNAADFIKV